VPSFLDARELLLAEMVAERYGPVSRRPAAAVSAVDTGLVVAERQRLLCAALDGTHLVAVDRAKEAA
jgi:hypothetical protein